MRRALDLAQLGLGTVSPNPMVGAVIVFEGKIIGEGWHQQFGGPHAEVNAVNSVQNSSLLPDSTLYVTLEPCSHYGKTPPCADLIIRSGFMKVVVAMEDPNPLVAGKGLAKLIAAGIEVECGVLEEESKLLNKRFLTTLLRKRPYVILKWAQTSDGFIASALNASKEEKQISNSLSQQWVHTWRAQEDALMVGYNTLIFDNPRLDARLITAVRQPTRITWDEREMSEGNYHFFDGSLKSIVFNHTKEHSFDTHRYLKIPEGEDAIQHLLERLWQEGMGSLIVEGGAKLLNQFLNKGLWDEARVCTSSKMMGTGIAAPVLSLKPEESFRLEDDQWNLFISPKEGF